jgi:hypothetical protein
MAVKQKCLDFSTWIEEVCLCKVGGLLKSEIGKQYGSTFLTPFTVLKIVD